MRTSYSPIVHCCNSLLYKPMRNHECILEKVQTVKILHRTDHVGTTEPFYCHCNSNSTFCSKMELKISYMWLIRNFWIKRSNVIWWSSWDAYLLECSHTIFECAFEPQLHFKHKLPISANPERIQWGSNTLVFL